DSGEVAIVTDPDYRSGSAARTFANTIAIVLHNALATAITCDAQPVMFAGSQGNYLQLAD
ncbi:MAG: hypothetical protein M3Y35_00425, partial [Actinomycetota bacterium]|nr:hypothetical protein [Actinomycetota bacterium]